MVRINHKYLISFDHETFDPDKPFQFETLWQKKEFLKKCKRSKGKKAYLCIQSIVKIKTNQQNKYYRGVVCARLAEYWGCSNKEAHDSIAHEHFMYQERPGGPWKRKSTALDEWTTIGWEEKMDEIRLWAIMDHGVRIELPNEVDFDSLPDFYY